MYIDLKIMTEEAAHGMPYAGDELIEKFMPLSNTSCGSLFSIINDANYLWFTICCDSVLVGDILVMLEGGEVSIAIRIVSNARGNGILSAVLNALVQVLRNSYRWEFNELAAMISCKNLASQKAFAKVGFEYCCESDGILEFRRQV